MPAGDPLVMWTVYDHPRDYPTTYVARKFLVTDQVVPTEEVYTAYNLEQLRNIFQRRGLFCLPREVNDDPNIVETWL